MKKITTFNKSNFLSASGLFVAAFLLLSIGTAAEGSFEVMCRNKAKEIAADTYKGCMTEYRQTQLEQIRKDYKEELSNLKNQYDKKLKKLSGGQSKIDGDRAKESVTTIELKKTKTKSASHVQLPVKKVGSGTQVIDLSRPIESQINDSDESSDTSLIEKNGSTDRDQTELVELANQQ